VSWSEGASLFCLVGGWGLLGGGGCGGFVFKLCLVWRVDCSLSTWTEDFPCKILFLGEGAAGGVKAISFQVSDMFPKMFPLAPHFYPICFGKCCPSFT